MANDITQILRAARVRRVVRVWNEPGNLRSCAAKRGALFGVLLREEVAEDVGHCLWTFTVPKLLRPFFLHRRDAFKLGFGIFADGFESGETSGWSLTVS